MKNASNLSNLQLVDESMGSLVFSVFLNRRLQNEQISLAEIVDPTGLKAAPAAEIHTMSREKIERWLNVTP